MLFELSVLLYILELKWLVNSQVLSEYPVFDGLNRFRVEFMNEWMEYALIDIELIECIKHLYSAILQIQHLDVTRPGDFPLYEWAILFSK